MALGKYNGDFMELFVGGYMGDSNSNTVMASVSRIDAGNGQEIWSYGIQ